MSDDTQTSGLNQNTQPEEIPNESQLIIGKTSATERDAITSDKFSFWLPDNVIVNPFDVVKVEQVNQPEEPPSLTFGLVTTLEHRTDAPNHLANFISSNFGEVDTLPNTIRQGTTVAFANILSNTAEIYMPLISDQPVLFADPEGIQQALGMDTLLKDRPNDAIPAGLIKMSNGATAVAYLDRRYVLGPESAHVNISGISGLATKTSYAMFLIQSILQKASDLENIAVIILNVKQADLLQVDQRREDALPPEQMERWEAIGLEPKPFENVRYLLPLGPNGQANSYSPVPFMHTLYAYDLIGVADKLDLLFSNVADTSGTIEGIYGEIMTGILSREAEFQNVQSWDTLLEFLREKQGERGRWRGMFAGSSIGMFRRHLRRIVQTRQTGIFVRGSRSRNEKLLSDELMNIKGGRIYVVDIAKLAEDEQTLVFGDILRTIYTVKSEEAEERTETSPVPEKVIIFVDELNKYAPGGRESPITQQVLDVAERGRSLGVILISAQQFMSAVHGRVTGNTATKIIGRTGSSEVNSPDYRFLEQDIRMAVTRLTKGELLVSHAVYRQPVKVIFPWPAYKQEQV
ncbi:MAG: ATP-binding protein [Chloroflexota bacterium]